MVELSVRLWKKGVFRTDNCAVAETREEVASHVDIRMECPIYTYTRAHTPRILYICSTF